MIPDIREPAKREPGRNDGQVNESYYSDAELLKYAEDIANQRGPEPMAHPSLLRAVIRHQFRLLNPGWTGKKSG